MRVFGKSAVLSAAALLALLAFGTTASAVTNVCASGKKKCVAKKTAGILKCYVKAEAAAENQGQVFTDCVNKAKAKFDGGTKGFDGSCFGKLENKYDFCTGGANDGEHCENNSACPGGTCTQGCLTDGDLAAMETKVDNYILDVETELNPGDTPPPNVVNLCASAKKKCVLKKGDGLLKCHIKCEKDAANCGQIMTDCLNKAKAKFDGGTKGFAGSCFGKAEAKYPGAPPPGCLTTGDLSDLEDKVDNFVDDVVCELDPSAGTCNAAVCGNSMVETGEDCDPPGTQCPNAATGIMCSASCQCACPSTVEFTGTSTGGVLDTGWTGIAHDATVISDGTVTVDITSCAGSSRPCGVCTFTGPIANAAAANYGAGTGTQMNNHRCTGNTRATCGTGGSDPTCTTAGGTCEFFFGSLLPLSAGGVATCVSNQFNGSFTGTANIETGTSTSSPSLTSRVFGGATNPNPCPRCIGDATPNDGLRGGTCSGGTDNGLSCDTNGTSPNQNFGHTSLDCRPSTSVLASLPIDLTNTTGSSTKTLTAASPNCRATGFTTNKCMCDTCNNGNANPCTSNTDCPDPPGPIGPICGGPRCTGGGNIGAACTVASQCPGGACQVPGLLTAPNQCNGGAGDCVPGGTPGPNDGECASGPTDLFCQPNGTMIGCSTDADCATANVRSCVGGANGGNVCSVASECPGGSCDAELCTGVKTRECFLDNGISGGVDTATGQAVVPVNDASNPTLAALFCIGPTTSTSVNAAAGLPGLGRLELQGFAQGKP